MNKQNNLSYKNVARLVSVVCGILFSVFCFTYLYVLQRNVVESLHFMLSGGRTHFSPFASALGLTLIFWAVGWGLNRLMRLEGMVQALSYFPSCLLLGMFTDVDRSLFHGGGIEGSWTLLLVLFVFISGVMNLLFRSCFSPKACTLPVMGCSNLIILFLLCLMTVCIGNTDVNFHHELAVEKAIRTKDYAAARRVGKKSLETTRTLTVLRHHALALDGSMGEHLFETPQYYGAEGLLFPLQSTETLRLNADSLYQYLGAEPYATENAVEYLERICQEEKGKHTALDYYLAALLLDKQLDRFITALEAYCVSTQGLPRYYREAICVYMHSHPDYDAAQKDSVMMSRLDEYLLRKEEFTNPREQENHMRREYGDTFWWYYDYQ